MGCWRVLAMTKMKMKQAKLIIADSEKDANLYYATRFLAPDSFVFVQVDGKKILLMSDLELDRAKSQAKVDEVLSLSQWTRKPSQRTKTVHGNGSLTAVDLLLKEYGVASIQVPSNFPLIYGDELRRYGYEVQAKNDPFFEERMIKSEEEIQNITETQRSTEQALEAAIGMIAASEIKNNFLYAHGQPLTSELIKKVLNVTLMGFECVAQHTIVAAGKDAVDPHNEGNGHLPAHEPIVMDIFPQSARTRYFADMTRTVVRGKALEKVKKMYQAVLEGQEIAFRRIKDGADGQAIHQEITDYFESLGFHTGEKEGRMQGFFHGTGHGLGLEVHEPPRVSKAQWILKAGMVVTVEPGLYYLDAGGIRLEDMVIVTSDGMKNLTQAPKILEI